MSSQLYSKKNKIPRFCIHSLSVGVLASCGVAPHSPKYSFGNKIWGGERVGPKDDVSKFAVAITRSNGFAFCTGSYLGSNIVLTAAHCVSQPDSPLLFVTFDSATPTESNPTYGNLGPASSRSRRVSRIVVHSEFNRANVDLKNEPSRPINDIALLFFEGIAPSDSASAKIVSPSETISENESISIAGFGRSDFGGGDYGRLYQVQTVVGAVRPRSLEIVDGPNSEKGSCSGDSGGPVFFHSTKKNEGISESSLDNLRIAGVVSYGPSNCDYGFGLNTDLRYFRDWVSANSLVVSENIIKETESFANKKSRLLDLETYVPVSKGSFFETCMNRFENSEIQKTVDAILESLGTRNCFEAAKLSLRVKTLDISGKNLTVLDPIKNFVSLESLNISNNHFSEALPIGYLIYLKQLIAKNSGINWSLTGRQKLSRKSFSQAVWLSGLKELQKVEVAPTEELKKDILYFKN